MPLPGDCDGSAAPIVSPRWRALPKIASARMTKTDMHRRYRMSANGSTAERPSLLTICEGSACINELVNAKQHSRRGSMAAAARERKCLDK